MPHFKATLLKFKSYGDKTGWTYVEIPKDILAKLKRKDKKAFRIKGSIDDVAFEKMSTYAVGDGQLIIAIKAGLRKKLGKNEGAMVNVKFEPDESGGVISKELLDCLDEDSAALKQFQSMPKSHQNYFHAYIEGARGADTKAGRIINTINAMHKKQNFGEMIRGLKATR